jgi:hypothetical protein
MRRDKTETDSVGSMMDDLAEPFVRASGDDQETTSGDRFAPVLYL